ncbi:hypothetical protein ACIBAC_15110 [Streptomyces sp. NPDC051362]|uniref:hypothetical protein n=1 Tax=Streptomyces sp. NPDC051362 TaxID=3365651 RepID=UPI00379FC15A
MSSDEQSAGLSPVERFSLRLREAQEEFERERRAEILAAVNEAEQDRDPLELVRAIAENYAAHRDRADADSMYAELTYELSLADVRALRLAADAAAIITPRLIQSARDNAQPVASIAADLGVTESYVYRILREQKARQEAGLGPRDGDPDTVCNDVRPGDRQKWPARCERQLGHAAPIHRGRGGDGEYHDWPVIPR